MNPNEFGASTSSQNQGWTGKRHPPHLKGKEIGLFYARRNKGKNKMPKQTRDQKQKLVVSMDDKKVEKIHNLLKDVRSKEYETMSAKGYNFSLEYKNHLSDSALREIGLVFDQPRETAVVRDANLDVQLYHDLQERFYVDKFKTMQSFRQRLPSYQMREQLIDIVDRSQVVVVMGETGCGKTTQVPQYILDSFIEFQKGSLCHIVCTQPRRISAISVAERVADERCVPCGNNQDVGYQIRLESKMPRHQGSILFCTTGVLLQQLKSNPYLTGISHVIVDEVHERNLDSDFLLISLREIITKRSDLKVIMMSATVNAEEFSAYFGDCPMIKIPGFTYPVEVYMLEEVIETIQYIPKCQKPNARRIPPQIKHTKKGKQEFRELARLQMEKDEYLRSISHRFSRQTMEILSEFNEEIIDVDLIVALLRHIVFNCKEGAVLIFLPGWQEISKLNGCLNEDHLFTSGNFLIIPLHSLMPTLNQREVFKRPPPGTWKIIMATNIAETSITIDDVVHVIDCGKIKMKSFDHEKNVQLLKPEWVAISNLKQREGRAGRTQPGLCYHLFTRFMESRLESYQLPEMLRTSLEETILKIKILKLGKAASFLDKAMNPPDPKTVALSLNNLMRLNALTDDENLTPLGYHLARLPMDPHTGKMILLGAIFSCLDPILSIAASLSFKDAFVIPLGKEAMVDKIKKRLSNETLSDHLAFAYAIQEWEAAESHGYGKKYCWEHFLSFSTLKMLVNLKRQYAQYLKQLHFISSDNPKHPDYNLNSGNVLLLKAIICAGLYPNVAKVNQSGKAKKNKQFRGQSQIKARTDDGHKVVVHPKSVNASESCIKTGWLVYHLKVMSTVVIQFSLPIQLYNKKDNNYTIYLHDTTAVTAYSLLFFGGKLKTSRIKIGKKKRAFTVDAVSVDNWIEFHCAEEKARLVMELRQELDKLLEHKITHPGVTDWSSGSQEAKVLNCIVELLTSEETLTVADLQNVNSLRNEAEEEDEEDDEEVYYDEDMT